MKKILAICLVLGLLMVFSGIAMSQEAKGAAPGASWYGPTGLIIIPTAETLGKGELRFHSNGVTWYEEKDQIWAGDKETLSEILPAITMGVTENLEIGVGADIFQWEYTAPGISLSEKSTNPMISAKYVVAIGKEKPQLLAVGLIHTQYEIGSGANVVEIKVDRIYVTSSKAFDAVKLHGGFYVTKSSNGSDKTSTQFAAGVEFPVIAKLTLSAEYLSKEKDAEDPIIAFGGRYSLTPNISVQIGSVDFGEGEQNIFAGLALKFGGKK